MKPDFPRTSAQVHQEFPLVSKDLLDVLNSIFPNKCPGMNDTERMIWVAVGARHVIGRLQMEYDRQNKQGNYAPGAPSPTFPNTASHNFIAR